MRVLLTTIGSRGEVQPVSAVARELHRLGHEAVVCAPPDFRELVEGMGIPFVALGPEVSHTAKASAPPRPAMASVEAARQALAGTVAEQFRTIGQAAADCDAIVAGGAMMVAARSIAEQRGIPYAYASFCPITLPSAQHAPLPMPGRPAAAENADNRALWDVDARFWNDNVGPALNAHRSTQGLPPVTDVRGHMFTERPWLAADPVLGPWPGDWAADGAGEVVQTGAWVLRDERPLAPELEEFLQAGEPPIYFGLGSVRAPGDVSSVVLRVARELGRRVVLLSGWAGLAVDGSGNDCLVIGEVNQQALFRRVAAVVHHGGAGTTTAAAGAGAPQVLVPQRYDQPYWGRRVEDLGIGCAVAGGMPGDAELRAALARVLDGEVGVRAKAVAAGVRWDGAEVAARRLIGLGG